MSARRLAGGRANKHHRIARQTRGGDLLTAWSHARTKLHRLVGYSPWSGPALILGSGMSPNHAARAWRSQPWPAPAGASARLSPGAASSHPTPLATAERYDRYRAQGAPVELTSRQRRRIRHKERRADRHGWPA